MIHLLIYSTTLIGSMIFMNMNHPLAMGLALLVQTLSVTLLTGMAAKSFWFSYILFLIFLGGMLILFIYVTSLASNEMFSLSAKLTMLASFSFILLSCTTLLTDKILAAPFFMNSEMDPLCLIQAYAPENSLTLSKLYNPPTNLVTLMLMNYLLITLIAIVKITNISQGALRPMN